MGYPILIQDKVCKLIPSILFGLLLPLFAQRAAPKIEVLIKDTNGRPMSGVSVRLTSGRRTIGTGETDQQGQISFPDLEAGRYGLTARKAEYEPIAKQDLDLAGPEGVVLELTMVPTLTRTESV